MFNIFIFALFVPFVLGGDVISLTKSNKDELAKHPLALVKYYAPWCGHCKALAPHYEEAATELKTKEHPVPLFEVNCDEESDMCGDAGVQGYPTLKLYSYGEFSEEFDGQRTASGIIEFLAERAGPPAKELTDASKVKEFVDSEDYTVVLQSTSADDIDELEKVARKMRKSFKFAYTKEKLLDSSKDTLLELSQPKQLETKLEERTKKYEGAMKADKIEEFVKQNAVGLAGIRDRKMESFFKKPMLVVYTQVNFERNPSNVRYHRNRLIQVAKDTKSKLQFALSDSLEFGAELYEAGVTSGGDATTVFIFGEDGKNYLMDEKFGVPELKKFVNDYVAGNLKPYIKSEPIPEKQEDHVIKVVGKTFDEIVNDKSKDVLVEFFAPWCGHCKALKPKYEELAKKLSKEKDIVIAAVDATANSFPSTFNVRGYPTLYWVPKNSKDKPVPYEGPREVDDLLKFVAKSATSELAHFTRDGKPKQEEL